MKRARVKRLLQVQGQLNGAGVSVALRDAQGLVLLGPVQVTALSAPGTPSGSG